MSQEPLGLVSVSSDVVADDRKVVWWRVWFFYGIAFGGAALVALILGSLAPILGSSATLVIQLGAALLYMPLPLVAGLLLERRVGRPTLLAAEWRRWRSGFWRIAGRSAAYAITTMLAILGLAFVVAWAAPLLGVPGAGHLALSDAELRDQMLRVVPGMPTDVALPSAGVLVATILIQGLLAGLTINAVFAFGEEYGWRWVLAHELRGLGRMRANLLTGVLWGLWHAPIIMLGHNYGSEWGWGIPMMVAWTTPLAFLLSWVRERAGSVMAPAMLHGAYNGTIGLFAFLVVGGQLFIALPMGALVAVVLTVLAVATRWAPARRAR